MRELKEITHRFNKISKNYIDAVPPGGIKVKQEDYFSMKNLYSLIREWAMDEGWTTRDESVFPEEFFFHREYTQGTELWIRWRFEKPAAPHVTYYKFMLDVDWHVLRLTPAEVSKNGKKYKADKGDCEVLIRGKVISDAQDTWKNHPILKHFETIFWKRIHKGIYGAYKRELYLQVNRLAEAVKNYMQISTYLPEEEGQQFWPKAKEFPPT